MQARNLSGDLSQEFLRPGRELPTRSAPGSGRGAGWALALVPLVLSLGAKAATAAPKVCGNQPPLGSFAVAQCPDLKDDGVAPDESAGDGIYTVAVQLEPTALLEYKVLPSGTYDGKELSQVGGACGVQGADKNSFKNIQIPMPDVSRKATFFYDARSLADPSYAVPPSNRSAGDDLMIRSAIGAGGCPQWLAIGEFQNTPFDKVIGAVPLTLQRPGVLVGRLTAMKDLPAGWKWKLVEGGGASPSRRYGPSGWAYEPCDTDSAAVSSPVRAGDVIYFTFLSSGGRLRTTVVASEPDAGVGPGAPLCPPVPDLRTEADPPDLSPPGTADLRPPSAGDGGALPTDGATADGAMRTLPGIHCDCQLGRSGGAAGGRVAGSGLSALPGLVLVLVGLLRVRRLRARAAPGHGRSELAP